jgi:hypothetical protein
MARYILFCSQFEFKYLLLGWLELKLYSTSCIERWLELYFIKGMCMLRRYGPAPFNQAPKLLKQNCPNLSMLSCISRIPKLSTLLLVLLSDLPFKLPLDLVAVRNRTGQALLGGGTCRILNVYRIAFTLSIVLRFINAPKPFKSNLTISLATIDAIPHQTQNTWLASTAVNTLTLRPQLNFHLTEL